MKSLKPRLLTAVVGITLIIIVLVIGEIWTPFIGIVIGLASAFMVGEYLNAKKLFKHYSLSIPCMLASFLASLLITTQHLYLLIAAFIIIAFVVMIAQHSIISYSDLAYAVSGTLLISFGMSSLYGICASGIGISFYFITAFALPWMADAGGFFVGATIGKHKLCPKISPKKTVEGAIGGIAFCIITAVLLGLVYQFWIMPDFRINFYALILLAVIDAPVSILGDLSFSLIKRSLGIKDYGSIFPGHGGMLDRFDSIIFTVPVMLAINNILPFITQV